MFVCSRFTSNMYAQLIYEYYLLSMCIWPDKFAYVCYILYYSHATHKPPYIHILMLYIHYTYIRTLNIHHMHVCRYIQHGGQSMQPRRDR